MDVRIKEVFFYILRFQLFCWKIAFHRKILFICIKLRIFMLFIYHMIKKIIYNVIDFEENNFLSKILEIVFHYTSFI